MHPIDQAAGWLFRFGPATRKVFTGGWGDEDLVSELDSRRHRDRPAELTIDWSEDQPGDLFDTRDATFSSPAPHLPESSRTGALRMITPHAADGRLVVLMAAWNDHGYATRTTLASLLAERGITTVMPENPYYGARGTGAEQPIRTVADFAVMGRAAVEEGRALLAHFAPTHRVGIAGYSMGGNTAALAGALSDGPVAIAALAASHSPGPVWLDGVIRHVVDWNALGGPEAAAQLRAELSRATVLSIAPRRHTSWAVIVGGRRDGYIPPWAVEDLHAHWPGSQLRWLNDGHATMLWRRKPALVDAIVASFDRVAA